MNEEMQEEFLIVSENGEEQKCRVVFTFDADEKSYVLFSLIDEMVMKFLETFLL